MLKALISLIVAMLIGGNLGGCGTEKPSEVLEKQIEEHASDEVMAEQVIQEYLLNYGIEIYETDGDCPCCGAEEVELTGVNLCLECSYDMVYANENDSEKDGSDDYQLSEETENDSNSHSATYGNDSGYANAKPTETIGKYRIDSNNAVLTVGNDGFISECNVCYALFFDNRVDCCPACGSNAFQQKLFSAEGLGIENILDAEYEVHEGRDFSTYEKRLTLQGFAGKTIIVRDRLDNDKIIGVFSGNSDYDYLDNYLDNGNYYESLSDFGGLTLQGTVFYTRSEVAQTFQGNEDQRILFEALGW